MAEDELPVPRISIREFEPEDLGQVQQIFRDGMMFYVDPADEVYYKFLEGYVESSLVGDLADIRGEYFNRGGGFWVATASQDGKSDIVVGIVALEKHADGRGEVRRVSTRAQYRRFGVGRILMAHVEQWAQSHGFDNVFLSTGTIMTHAQKFYDSLGYVATGTFVFCKEPHYVQIIYVKQLKRSH